MSKPDFSIIVPSYLSHYPGCASYREQKFIRAIDSAINQLHKNFEIIIVADGCDKTKAIYDTYYTGFSYIKLISIPKQVLWSGNVRNAGIEKAQGEYVTYLDTDDKLGINHLTSISNTIADFDWAWYDDYLMNKKYRAAKNPCQLKYGYIGTSNITHRRSLGVLWKDSTYKHDWVFIQELMRHKNYGKIAASEYFICHQPGKVDV